MKQRGLRFSGANKRARTRTQRVKLAQAALERFEEGARRRRARKSRLRGSGGPQLDAARAANPLKAAAVSELSDELGDVVSVAATREALPLSDVRRSVRRVLPRDGPHSRLPRARGVHDGVHVSHARGRDACTQIAVDRCEPREQRVVEPLGVGRALKARQHGADGLHEVAH